MVHKGIKHKNIHTTSKRNIRNKHNLHKKSNKRIKLTQKKSNSKYIITAPVNKRKINKKHNQQHNKQSNKHHKNLKSKRKQTAGNNNKCNPSRLNDLLAANPPAHMSQEIPTQSITVRNFDDYNMKGLGKSPGPPPRLPSGCSIM